MEPMKRYRSVLNRGFSGVNPVTYGNEDCEPGHAFGYAVREYYLIHFITRGKGIFIRNGIEHSLSDNSLFLIRPGERTYYAADKADPWSYIWIGFDGEASGGLLAEAGFTDAQCTGRFPRVRHIFEEIAEIRDQEAATELLLTAKIYEFLGRCAGAGQAVRSYPGYHAARACDFIRTNYASRIRITELAELLHLDRHYFTRIFRQEQGCTPKEFLIGIRMVRAAELLCSGTLSIQEVARSVGYGDPLLFSRIFRKKYGVSPREYRSGG
ncbi:AraC family transcriptional regulator [Breznakiella homolactica]|uniref:AraC family transcriptional regulator n=1 Tax=Breznakiella homolactica TaxID=2798577 RepID=A0A7T7XMP2_9SPIR|nr:AraC family transcriptional regulator [Breznakiella homolactica]QQO09179.1 AraC family transcriptional regulator [Breznakiella homolactica]